MKEVYIRLSIIRDKNLIGYSSYLNNIDGLVIEPHIFYIYKKSLSEFLSNIYGKKLIFDMSLFRYSPSAYELYKEKIWYQKLVNLLDIPITATTPYLDPRAVSKTQIYRIAEKSFKFQTSYLKQEIQKVQGLKAFLLQKQLNVGMKGTDIITSPYLLIEDVILEDDYIDREEFLKFNIKMLKETIDLKKNKKDSRPVMGVIALSPDVMDNNFLNKVIKEYNKLKPDIIGIWISGLNEHQQLPQLRSMLEDLIIPLREENKMVKIMNMYAGFFSFMIMHMDKPKLLDSVVFGIGYGEHRTHDVYATGYPLRYYFKTTHRFENANIMVRLYSYDPELVKCSCPVCQNIRNQIDFESLQKNWYNLSEHFIYNRLIIERNELKSKKDLNELIKYLDSEINEVEKILKRTQRIQVLQDYFSSIKHTMNKWKQYLKIIGKKKNL